MEFVPTRYQQPIYGATYLSGLAGPTFLCAICRISI